MYSSWKSGDGGELEVTPFCGKMARIEPLHSRMAIFHSDRMLHRVLPSIKPRYCFTIWIDGANVNSDNDVFLKAKHLALLQRPTNEMVEFFRNSPLQRLLARAVYQDEYAKSLLECQGQGAPCMVDSHNANVSALQHDKSLGDMVNRLQEYIRKTP
eukprot:m.217044 g.217044  ORF g.217044 m.217044 type:complete len:156 (-) comp15883_c0_seq13:4543-5010(-)